MKVNCCYRLTPSSEVIHSFYDTDSGLVDGMPIEFLDTRFLKVPEYSVACYRGLNVQFDSMAESILLSSTTYAFVLEVNGLTYSVLQWDGVWRSLKSATDDEDNFCMGPIPHPELFKVVGYRPTKLRQYRTCPGIYRLCVSKYTKRAHTQDGILECEFDVDALGELDYRYAGYKDAVNLGYFAVVYLGGTPTFLEKTPDNKLRIVS